MTTDDEAGPRRGGPTAASPSGLAPIFASTPDDALGEDVWEQITIAGRDFRIVRPKESDAMLDHPEVQAAFARDEYIPYWIDLWPASSQLAQDVLTRDWSLQWPGFAPGTRTALEIGCGLGLSGVAALAAGFSTTFTDCDHAALRWADRNARANGFTTFATRPLDWRSAAGEPAVDLVLASDVTYEERLVDGLVEFLSSILAPGALALLTDQDRTPAPRLRRGLESAGLSFNMKHTPCRTSAGRDVRVTLYEIRRA